MNQAKKDAIEFILKAIMVIVWVCAVCYFWRDAPTWGKTCLVGAAYFIRTFKF